MECRTMTLENRGDRRKRVIAAAQRRDRRNGEMLPGNKSQRRRRERAKYLCDEYNSSSTESIRQMAGGQGQCNHGHGDD